MLFPIAYSHYPGMFAGDTYITVPGVKTSSDIEPKLKGDLEAIEKWLEANRLSCNIAKMSRRNTILSKHMALSIYGELCARFFPRIE